MYQSASAQPPTRDTETERIRGIYDKEAVQYDRKISFAERLVLTDGRQWVCSQADGLTLEVAVGTGRNFAFYLRRCESCGESLLMTYTSASWLSASADFCSSPSCWTQRSQVIPMCEIRTMGRP